MHTAASKCSDIAQVLRAEEQLAIDVPASGLRVVVVDMAMCCCRVAELCTALVLRCLDLALAICWQQVCHVSYVCMDD